MLSAKFRRRSAEHARERASRGRRLRENYHACGWHGDAHLLSPISQGEVPERRRHLYAGLKRRNSRRRQSRAEQPGRRPSAPKKRRALRSCGLWRRVRDRKSTRLNSSHLVISYAVFCLKKKKKKKTNKTSIKLETST